MIFPSDMIEPKIIFENDDVLVIDKPCGLAVHADGEDASGTVVEWFLRRFPSSKGVGEPRVGRDGAMIERSGVVHRLDRETSGVMVLAKTQEAFDFLKRQFLERSVKKEYRAFVYGAMKERWGTIDRPIGRSAKDWRRRSAERGARGTLRPAVTEWETLQSGEYAGEKFSFLKLRPKTGRQHQLRVHLKSIGRPIVADPIYAGNLLGRGEDLGLERLALHSLSLSVDLMDGESCAFEAPLPKELEEALGRIA